MDDRNFGEQLSYQCKNEENDVHNTILTNFDTILQHSNNKFANGIDKFGSVYFLTTCISVNTFIEIKWQNIDFVHKFYI